MEVIKAKGRKNVGSPQEVWVVKTEAVFQSVGSPNLQQFHDSVPLEFRADASQLRATSHFGELKMLYST